MIGNPIRKENINRSINGKSLEKADVLEKMNTTKESPIDPNTPYADRPDIIYQALSLAVEHIAGCYQHRATPLVPLTIARFLRTAQLTLEHSKILPCPFCGEQPQLIDRSSSSTGWTIACGDESHTIIVHNKIKEKAIEAWNKRVD